MILFKFQIKAMQGKQFIFLLIAFLFCQHLFGQHPSPGKRDTVFIYRTKIVLDTLVIHDTIWIPRNETISRLDKMSSKPLYLNDLQPDARLLLFFNHESATIPVNSILLAENLKNSVSMKKLSFIGVVLFAFQSMVLAQSDFGLSAGTGLWWTKCNVSSAGSEFSPLLNIGTYAKVPLHGNLFLRTGINYHYMFRNGSYKQKLDYSMPVTIGDGESASAYHLFSLPLQLGLELPRFEPYLGMEYTYRVSESWLNAKKSSLGVSAGLNYNISSLMSLGLNYQLGLKADTRLNGSLIDPLSSEVIGNYDYSWKTDRVQFSLYYSLKKSPSKTTEKPGIE
jgi:hypothetical protein